MGIEFYVIANANIPKFTSLRQRTKRLTKASRQLPPDEFAKILIEKLEKVVIQREQEERAALNLACLPHEVSMSNFVKCKF